MWVLNKSPTLYELLVFTIWDRGITKYLHQQLANLPPCSNWCFFLALPFFFAIYSTKLQPCSLTEKPQVSPCALPEPPSSQKIFQLPRFNPRNLLWTYPHWMWGYQPLTNILRNPDFFPLVEIDKVPHLNHLHLNLLPQRLVDSNENE